MFGRVVLRVVLVALMSRSATSNELDDASLGTLNHTLFPIEPKEVSATPQEPITFFPIEPKEVSSTPQEPITFFPIEPKEVSFTPQEPSTFFPIEPKVVGPSCQFPFASVSVPAGGSVTFSSPSFFLPQICGWQFSTVAGSALNLQCQAFNLNGPDSVCVYSFQNWQLSSYSYTLQNFPSNLPVNAQTMWVFFLHRQLSSLGSFSCTITASGTAIITTARPTTPPNANITTARPTTSTCRCGIVKRTSRIMGGVNTQVNEYPWQVGLMYTGTRFVFCGGSLINNRYIVTAAHCMKTETTSSFQLLLGGHSKDAQSATEKIVNPIKIITHPQYQVGTTQNNDISIIEIAPLNFTDPTVVARPICLPNSADTYDGVTATVTGWGTLYSGGPQSDILQEVDVSVVTNAFCATVYGAYVTNSVICAGTVAGGKDTCQGDSGGPMIAPDGANYELIGVTSFGNGCGKPNIPGAYARVSTLQSWIESTVAGSTTCGR